MSIMTTHGSRDEPIAILKDAIFRGNHLLPVISAVRVLNMFTEMLPSAKGVSKELYAADMARFRKSLPSTGVGGTVVAPPWTCPVTAPTPATPTGKRNRPRWQSRLHQPSVTLPLAEGGAGAGHHTHADAAREAGAEAARCSAEARRANSRQCGLSGTRRTPTSNRSSSITREHRVRL